MAVSYLVVLDMDPSSPTYKQWENFTLSDSKLTAGADPAETW